MSRVESKIEFYAAVPISTDFKHEPLFDSKEEQIAYFDNFKVGAMTGSYQRVEEQIRTNKKYEHLLDVNYVHVINPSYEGSSYNCEWWGFVMDIHYDSDGLVYVDWVVDPIQTFMFKWDLSKAFIERGMLNVVKEKGDQYYLDNNLAPLLANQEEIGVDGLAYELLYDDLFEDAGNSGDVNFLVIALADAETMNFIGTPTQLTYYVLPYNTSTGQLLDFRVENVTNLNQSNKLTIETSKNKEQSLATAIKKFADDVKLTNGGKSIVVSFLQKEIGLAFSYDSNKRKLVTKLGDTEWGGYNQNMELYEIGSKTSGSSSGGGSSGDSGSSGGSGGGSGTFTDGDIVNSGYSISNENINLLLKYARQRNIMPSFMIAQMFFESHWGDSGTSVVGSKDNNWSGISMPFTPPAGVTITQGSARPEGGHYVHFNSLDDYFNSYCFVLSSENGIYNVEGKKTLSEYVKGLFRIGGAKYDYAASGYEHYLSNMQACYNAINSQNPGKLEKLDGLMSKSLKNRSLEAKSVEFLPPCKQPFVITSEFGYRTSPISGASELHNGIDLAISGNPTNTPIYASADGEVIQAGVLSPGWESYGNYIVIRHNNGFCTGYAHNASISVSVGDKVSQGQQIGIMGATGDVTGIHSHFQLIKDDPSVPRISGQSSLFKNPREKIDFSLSGGSNTGGSSGGGSTGGGSGGDKPTPPQGSGIYALKINRFRFPKIAQKYVQLLVENKKNDYTKYRLIREALNITLGQTHPETINYINSLQGPKGLEKLCCAPFCTMTLSNGKGVQKNFNLANFKKQEAPFLVDVKGFLGKSNRVEFYFEHYLNYVVDNGEGEESRVQGEAAIRKDSLIDATMKNFDLYIDASKSYEYLNQNRISQSIDNAKFAVSQNNIQQSNSERNFALGQANTRNINSINQSGARKQLDNTQYGQWQQYGLQGAKTMVGALGGAAASIAQGGPVIGGAAGVAGAVTGVAQYALDGVGVMASQNIANQSLNIAQSTANAALAANQGTEQKVFYNNLTTSQLIASNQYENAIANINAGLADIRNEPDISAVSGSDYNFEVAWDNDSYYAILYTINPQALIIAAEFFAQFGYKIRRYDSISNYMKVKPSFNYVKTNGADVKGRISNKWRNALNMIFDSGITFWRDKEKMKKRDITGNY